MPSTTETPYSDLSTGQLVARISQQVSTLVHDEMQLAQAEMKRKALRAGVGAGLLANAGALALFGSGCLVAAAVLALNIVLAAWLSAIIVGGLLLIGAGMSALLGKGQVTRATPPLPSDAIQNVRSDIDAIKFGAHR